MSGGTLTDAPGHSRAPGSHAVPAEPAPRAHPRWHVFAAAAAYLAYAIFLTRPLAWNLGTHMFGGGGDDNWGLLAGLREGTEQGLNPFQAGPWRDFAAPEGLDVSWAVNVISWPSANLLLGLTHLLGPIAAVGVFVLAGFVLNGVAGFLLARRLTGNPVAAFIAGFALAFFPLAVAKAQLHQHYMHAWVFVLLVWRLLELSERPSLRNGALAGLAAVFAFSWTPYFALFGSGAYVAFLAVDALRAVRVGRFWQRLGGHAVSGAIVLSVLALYAVASASSPEAGFLPRSIAEAYVYSARPLELLLPDAQNVVFGGLTGDYLFSHAHGSGYGEFNGYLGWSLLLLGAVAVYLAVRGRLASTDRWRVLALVAVALAAVLLSAPPTADVGPVRLYFPGWLVFQVTDGFRVFARAVILLMVPVALLAAYGLAALLRRRGVSGRGRLAVLVLGTAIVALDLSAPAITRTTEVPEPGIYDVLREQPPGGIVAEYPLVPSAIPDYEAMLFQGLHDRPVLNGYASGTDQEVRALSLQRIDNPRVPKQLRLLGVRWLVVDESPPSRPDVAPVPPPAEGLTLVERVDSRALYRVDAPAAVSATFPAEGFGVPEGDPFRPSYWSVADTAEIEVHANCDACTGVLRFAAASFHQPRTMEVRAGGRRLAVVRIRPDRDAQVRVPLRFRRAQDVELVPTPGPQSVRETTGAADDRRLAIHVKDARFVLDPAG